MKCDAKLHGEYSTVIRTSPPYSKSSSSLTCCRMHDGKTWSCQVGESIRPIQPCTSARIYQVLIPTIGMKQVSRLVAGHKGPGRSRCQMSAVCESKSR